VIPRVSEFTQNRIASCRWYRVSELAGLLAKTNSEWTGAEWQNTRFSIMVIIALRLQS